MRRKPNLDILILLLANPIVLIVFTRALLLLLVGLGVAILASTLGCYYFISLVPDTIYICIDFTGRLAQFISSSTDMRSMILLCTSLVFDTVYSCSSAICSGIFSLVHDVVHSCIRLFSLLLLAHSRSAFTVVDISVYFFKKSRFLYWILALGRAHQGGAIAFGC